MPQDSRPDTSCDVYPDKSQENQTVTRPGLWIGIGGLTLLVAFAGLAVVAVYFVNEHSERIKFFTVNALSVSVLAAIIVQACVYWGQRNLMRVSLAENRDIFYKGQRAYIGIKHVIFQNLGADARPTATLILKNAGHTPAWAVEIRTQPALGTKHPSWADVASGKVDGVAHFIPADEGCEVVVDIGLTFTEEMISDIKTCKRILFVRGTIIFTDISRARQTFPFCVTLRPGGKWGDCQQDHSDNPNQAAPGKLDP